MVTGLLATATTADAQYVEHWRREGAPFFANPGSNLTRGMALNLATDHVLVATRNGGNAVRVLEALDGSDVGTMDITGVSGGTFPLNKIDAVDRGAGNYSVYLANLTTNTTGATPTSFQVYRWAGSGAASETTIGAPTVIYRNRYVSAGVAEPAPIGPVFPLAPGAARTGVRVGDSLEARYDSGTNQTTIYLGVSDATASNYIFTLTIDEATGSVTAATAIPAPGQVGTTHYGVSAEPSGAFYSFTAGAGQSRKYDASGVFIGAFDSVDTAGLTPTQPRFMQLYGRNFIGYVSINRSLVGLTEILADSDPIDASLVTLSANPTTPLANTNAAGDMAVDTLRGRFIGLTDNNYLVSFSHEDVLLIELESFSASVAEPSGTVTIDWTTASEIDNVGFNVYRRVRLADGTFAPAGKVNGGLIPAEGVDGAGASYSLVDPLPMAPGGARAYVLEDVDANGTTTRHAPSVVRRDGSNTSVGEWSMF
jgi:hypothetical protein